MHAQMLARAPPHRAPQLHPAQSTQRAFCASRFMRGAQERPRVVHREGTAPSRMIPRDAREVSRVITAPPRMIPRTASKCFVRGRSKNG
eukprot:7383411-Prymnesium_polylepis.1